MSEKTIQGKFQILRITHSMGNKNYRASVQFDPPLSGGLLGCDGQGLSVQEALDNLKKELIGDKDIKDF